MRRLLLVSLLALVFTGQALADQCAWNDKSVAQRARAFLAYNPGPIFSLCEPCNDKQLREVVYGQDKADTLDKRAVHFRWIADGAPTRGAVGWEVTFNEGFRGVERKVDLAYIFVRSGTGGFVNVGAMFKCTNNTYWNSERARGFSGMPNGVSPYLQEGQYPVVQDVSEESFMRAYAERYPNDPRG